MRDYLMVLAIALLPVAGNLGGVLVAESVRVASRVVGAALHAAAGVAIAVVSIELMPRILETTPPWLMVVAFGCGAAFTILLARGVERVRESFGVGSSGAWMVFLAVSADLLSDGLMIGVGAAVSGGLGLLLGLSQVVANIPGGFAALANFRDEGVARRRRLVVAGAFVLPVLVGASAGYWLLRGTSDAVQSAALAFVVGVLLLATVEDVVPQADEPGTRRWLSTIAFTVGFAFFGLLSAYLG